MSQHKFPNPRAAQAFDNRLQAFWLNNHMRERGPTASGYIQVNGSLIHFYNNGQWVYYADLNAIQSIPGTDPVG